MGERTRVKYLYVLTYKKGTNNKIKMCILVNDRNKIIWIIIKWKNMNSLTHLFVICT